MGKQLDKVGKKAKGTLAGFDRLNTLSLSDGSGSSNLPDYAQAIQDFSDFSGAMTEMADDTASKVGESFAEKIQGTIKDISVYVDKNFGPSFRRAVKKIVPQIDKLGDTFGRVWDDISTLGTPLKNWFTDEYTTYLQTYIDTAGDIVSGLLDSFNMVFSDIWDVVIFPFLQTFSTTILPTLTEFGTQVLLTLGTLFGEIKTLFDLLWTEGVKPGLDLIVGIWQDVWESISQAWDKWGAPIFDNIRLAIENTGNTLQNIWNTILKPVWDKIMEVVDRLWNEHLKPLVDNFLDFVGEFVNGALEIYNKFILPIVNWLVKTFGPAFTEVFGTIAEIVGTVFGVIADVVGGIITALKGVIQFITGVFTGDWDKAWTGIKNIFKGIWDAIWGIIKGVINLIIDGLNALWKGLYYAVKGIVDTIGGVSGAIGKLLGQDWSFEMPEKPPLIPRLAAGGVIEQPTLAMVGEYAGARHNPEIVTPESKMREIFGESNNAVVVALYEVAQMIIEAIRDTSGGDDLTLEEFVRRLYPAIEREKSRRGTVSFAKT